MKNKFDKIAKNIVVKLTLEEKISLMSGNATFEDVRSSITKKSNTHYNESVYTAGGLKNPHIPSLKFADGARGVVCGRGTSTCFPVPSLRGASFNTKLEEKIGEAISEEVAFYGGNFFGGVCINLPYNPGWGRCQETYGEDSFLLGEMGSALVKGVQHNGIIACLKHFAFNSMENSRFDVNISCSKRAEREVFLSHFKKCIDAGAGAIMSAYNKYMGEMCGENKYLLTDVLRNEWGFDGITICDFVWGVKNTKNSANAGLNIEMPITKYYGHQLVKAVNDGLVSEDRINQASFFIIKTLLDFEERASVNKTDTCDFEAHRKLALKSAEEGIILIKNDNNVLPLKKNLVKNIAVIGNLADKQNIGDKGSSQVYPPYVVTILDGIRNTFKKSEVTFYPGDNINHIKRLSKQADVVIVVAGNDYLDEGEFVARDKNEVYTESVGGDRKDGLSLKKSQIESIKAAGASNDNTIVIIVGGSTILTKQWDRYVKAILYAFYPGMEGGNAVANILSGKTNPSGKLPFVIPFEENNLPTVDWSADEQYYDYYYGYSRLDKNNIQPAYHFGFGLSYTSFEIGDSEVISNNNEILILVPVRNTGKMTGSEVVQVYVGKSDSIIERPKRVLKGFSKVNLKPNEEKIVSITIKNDELAYYDEEKEKFFIEPGIYQIYVGNCNSMKHLESCDVTIPSL